MAIRKGRKELPFYLVSLYTDDAWLATDGTMDKVTEALVQALKQALAEAGEQRLFKSGKLDGLFSSRNGVPAEAAARAVREGLVEVVRTEPKGKTTIEWVRPTPRGLEFLHQQESPIQALRDLQAILQVNRERIPLWLGDQQRELQTLATRLAEEAARWTQRLEALSQQVEAALRRADLQPPLSDGAAADAPWAAEALAYLDRRRLGAAGDCPLPELFAVARQHAPTLSVTDFHDRLRRLRDRRALRLLPFTEAPSELPEPEYALLDGATLLYYATR
jgi:hypothetical protein